MKLSTTLCIFTVRPGGNEAGLMVPAIAWPEVVKALKESGYEGDFTYESAQNLKYLPEDNVLRMEMMRYTVKLGRYLMEM